MKVRDVIRAIKEDGWYLYETKGSHRQFKHSVKSGRVTISGHPWNDVYAKTLYSILRQAGIEDWR